MIIKAPSASHMHEEYWGFSQTPFSQTPDPRFYYLGHVHEDALMMLHYGLSSNRGALLLTGGLGTGKTSLCYKVVSMMAKAKIVPVIVTKPDLSPLQLELEILSGLGAPIHTESGAEADTQLRKKIGEVFDGGARVLLALDNAHSITSNATFDTLAKLADFHVGDQFMINLVMTGQPSLNEMVAKFLELDQLFAVRQRLSPFTRPETQDMLDFRLRAAGYTGDRCLFDSNAVHELHSTTQGVPRMICHLANHALDLGRLKFAHFIDGPLMREAIGQFYGEPQETA